MNKQKQNLLRISLKFLDFLHFLLKFEFFDFRQILFAEQNSPHKINIF